MIDLCIVNYNTLHLLKRFLTTLHSDAADYPDLWRIFIADNGSVDGSKEWLFANGSAFMISDYMNNANIGYSNACNALAAAGQSEIICLLNSDVWLTSGDLNAVNEIFKEDSSVDILGPKQRDESGYITHAGIIGTNKEPKHRGWKEYDPEDVMFRDRVDCVTVSGSAYFIRRSVWNSLWHDEEYRQIFPEATGAFLPTPHYYEETWCSYFARHRGYNVVYDGSVSIGHSWHKSSPVGGEADKKFAVSREIFRDTCDRMGIERD